VALDLGSARVRDWMTTSVPVITTKTTVATALRLLREHGLPALPVYAENGLVGLVEEKALLRLTPSEATTLDVYELHQVLDQMTVARVTVPPRATIAPEAALDEAAALVIQAGADVIPVVDQGRFLGLLTPSGLLAAVVRGASAGRRRDALPAIG
jgi:acetoin utilization protein AcuB